MIDAAKKICILLGKKSLAHAVKWSIETSFLDTVCCTVGSRDTFTSNQPDLLVTDAASFNLLNEQPHPVSCPVLLLTGLPDDHQLADALYTGVDAIADISHGPATAMEKIKNLFENKPDETQLLLQKIVLAARGQSADPKQVTDYGLTIKEKEILKLMRDANHLKLISQITHTTYETVRTHVKNIYKKIGVSSASEAVLKALHMDL